MWICKTMILMSFHAWFTIPADCLGITFSYFHAYYCIHFIWIKLHVSLRFSCTEALLLQYVYITDSTLTASFECITISLYRGVYGCGSYLKVISVYYLIDVTIWWLYSMGKYGWCRFGVTRRSDSLIRLVGCFFNYNCPFVHGGVLYLDMEMAICITVISLLGINNFKNGWLSMPHLSSLFQLFLLIWIFTRRGNRCRDLDIEYLAYLVKQAEWLRIALGWRGTATAQAREIEATRQDVRWV